MRRARRGCRVSDRQVYLLDSGGISRWVGGDRRRGACTKDANRSDIPVITTSIHLAEAYHAPTP